MPAHLEAWYAHMKSHTLIAPSPRLAAWSKAVLERPSFQETAPDAEVVIKSMAKFVNPLSD